MKISAIVDELKEVPGILREAATALRAGQQAFDKLEKIAAARKVRAAFSNARNVEDDEMISLGGKLLEKIASKSAKRSLLGEPGDDTYAGLNRTLDEEYLNQLRLI